MVAFFKAEAFEYYFDYFTEDSAPTKEAKPFQVVKKAMLENFSTKTTDAETIREAFNHQYVIDDIKEVIFKAEKLYKEAKFSEELKFEIIHEVIRSDQALMYFVHLKKATTYEQVKEACLEYADSLKVYVVGRR